jgi:DNA-binding NarL/FixJ family response regulator
MANAKSSVTTGASSPSAPPTVVVVLRCTLPPPLLRHLFAIGAAGYVPAEPPANTAAEQWIAAAANVADADGDPSLRAALLSPCELEVVQLIGTGQSTRAIASALHRSIKTIETYRSRIRAKLGLKNPTALAQWAWQFTHPAGNAGSV